MLVLDALWFMECPQPYKEKMISQKKKKKGEISKVIKLVILVLGFFSFFENNVLFVTLQSSKNKASDVLYSV